MNTKRRWMKWIDEVDGADVALPWARGARRNVWKSNAKARARAA